jgi:hypothetical protein
MNEVDAIFDAVSKAAAIVIRQDKIREKRKQIASVTERRCGNCDHWMKSTCKPEKEKKQFKSMNSFACSAFLRSVSSKMLEQRFNDELAEIGNETTESGENELRNGN